MTEDEYREYQRLVNEYNRLVSENNRMIEEITYAQEAMVVLAENMATVSAHVIPNVKYVSEQVNVADTDVSTLMRALEELTSQYFIFKELSTASKNLTQYNDEYFTRFQFFNELRRITLGYVIGLDSYIISNESLRKKVEKCYLSNTDYWLAYAIMSVMLWASNEKSAADRALHKALKMDSKKSSVFYMLVNLRFVRIESASKWYLYYLDKTDVNDLGDEWQKLLQAYLSGALGADPKLENAAMEYYQRIFEQTQALNAGYNLKVQARSETFIANFLHTTESEFPALSLSCSEYPTIKQTLSNFEKFSVVAKYYDDINNMEEDRAVNTNERIENVLYDLINSYDEKEFEIVRKIKYNEAIIAAKGDVAAAQRRYHELYGDIGVKLNAGDMLLKWAFSEDYVETDVAVKKFSLSQLSDDIVQGFKNYAQKIKSTVLESFHMNVDGCELVCTQNNYDECAGKINDFFLRNRFGHALKDKQFIIFLLICAASLVLLGAAALFVRTEAFSVLLALGIVVGILGGFLVWRRYVDIGKVQAEKCRKALIKLRDLFEELHIWRSVIDEEAKNDEALYNAVNKFKQ